MVIFPLIQACVLFMESTYTVAFLVLHSSVFLDRMLIFVNSFCILSCINNCRRRIKSKITFSYTQVWSKVSITRIQSLLLACFSDIICMCLFTWTETLDKWVMKKEVSLTQDSKFIMHFIQKSLNEGFFLFIGFTYFIFNHSFISSASGCSFS